MKDVFVAKNLLLIMPNFSYTSFKVGINNKKIKFFCALFVPFKFVHYVKKWLHIFQSAFCSYVEWSIKVMPQYFPADKSLC